MKTNSILVERITTDSKLFAQTRWDAIPVVAGLLHCAYFFGMFYLFPRTPLSVMIIYGGNPDEPLAWDVSSYDKLYNWTWFYNGYHAEHHFRPKVHWTRMQAFRDQIVEQQRAAGVRVIKPPHALGFLDPDLPPHPRSGSMNEQPRPT
jgi:fatty acid desaturase